MSIYLGYMSVATKLLTLIRRVGNCHSSHDKELKGKYSILYPTEQLYWYVCDCVSHVNALSIQHTETKIQGTCCRCQETHLFCRTTSRFLKIDKAKTTVIFSASKSNGAWTQTQPMR